MRFIRPTTCSEHRYARFLAWLFALLFWVVRAGLSPIADDRRRRRHYALQHLRRAARNLILIRAAALLRPHRPTPLRPSRNHARAGFIRRMGYMRVPLRQIAGAWMRRRLRGEGGPIARVVHLIRVLREIDPIACAFAKRPLIFTRLRPLIPTRPPNMRVHCLAAPAGIGADSS